MTHHSDILIIGGGIIGLACAHYLSESGLTVRIIEKDRIGAGASHGNCGLLAYNHLVPLCAPGEVGSALRRMTKPGSPLQITLPPTLRRTLWLARFAAHCNARQMRHGTTALHNLIRLSKTLFSGIMARHRFVCGYSDAGLLAVCADRKELAAQEAGNVELRRFGYDVPILTAAELYRRAPMLKPGLAGAGHLIHDRHVRPDQLIREWQALLRDSGVAIHSGCPLVGVTERGNRIRRVETPSGGFSADHYVVAAGAGSRPIAGLLGVDLPIVAGRGYSVTVDRPLSGLENPLRLGDERVLITPWKDGYRIGGMMEFSGAHLRPDPRRIRQITDVARRYVPALSGGIKGADWVGMRPMLHDDLPVIDRVAGRPDLLIAAGHGMLGLTLAPATGKLITRLVHGQPPDIPLSPFRLDRFARLLPYPAGSA